MPAEGQARARAEGLGLGPGQWLGGGAQSHYEGNHRGGRPKAATFVLVLNKAHVLALNTAHVLRLSNPDVLALNKAHVLRLNTKICPAFTANTKETTKVGAAEGRPPFVEAAEGRPLCVGCEHWAYLSVET